MSTSDVFAVLLVAALCGWSWFLVRISQARLDDAKALETLERIGGKIDERVAQNIAIIANRMKKRDEPEPPEQKGGTRVLDDAIEALNEARRLGTKPYMYTAPGENEESSTGIPEMPMPVEG